MYERSGRTKTSLVLVIDAISLQKIITFTDFGQRVDSQESKPHYPVFVELEKISHLFKFAAEVYLFTPQYFYFLPATRSGITEGR